MFLHHVVTLMLYGFSYLLNMTAAGAVVMFLHDWADVWTSVVRCFIETTLMNMTWFGITGMAITWIWTRIYMFPFVIYSGCFKYDMYKGEGFVAA